jgi:galactitol-specific phosphotransferase system IIB component
MFLKKLLHNNLTIVIAATVVFASCQSGNKSGNSGQPGADSTKLTEISKDVKDVIYPLPTPFETTKMLNDMGAKYVSSSLNSVAKADKYFTEKSKAVNLGIYGADVAYAVTYNQKQDVKVYSKAVKTLLDQLGINVDYTNLLTDEAREKMNNKDTLISVITNTFHNTYKNLNEKNNPELAVMMISGMWVELMYIATHISEDTYHNSGVVKLITNQKDSYSKLMSLLSGRNTNADVKSLESQLQVLKPVFDKIDSGLSEKDYLLILQTIQNVRNSLAA